MLFVCSTIIIYKQLSGSGNHLVLQGWLPRRAEIAWPTLVYHRHKRAVLQNTSPLFVQCGSILQRPVIFWEHCRGSYVSIYNRDATKSFFGEVQQKILCRFTDCFYWWMYIYAVSLRDVNNYFLSFKIMFYVKKKNLNSYYAVICSK